jgi:acyl-CoA thioester hydrolase
MGYMYYGNYAQFYEVARVEMLRNLGLTYKGFEDNGIMMPVLELKCKYIKPAYYDDELTVKVLLKEIPASRITFFYEIYNAHKELINLGETTLVFVDIKSKRPCRAPQDFLSRINPYFSEGKHYK